VDNEQVHKALTEAINAYVSKHDFMPEYVVCYDLDIYENLPRPFKIITSSKGDEELLNVFYSDTREGALFEIGSFMNDPVVVYEPEAVPDTIAPVIVGG